MKKAIALLMCLTIACASFVACSKPIEEPTTTTTTTTEATTEAISTTEATTTTTTEEATSEKTTKADSTTKKTRTTNADTSISINEALDYLEDFYGKDYIINSSMPDEDDESKQNFKIVTKDGQLYARVKINLDNGEMTEKIVETDETNTFIIR